MAFLVLLLTAAGARVVATDILQRIAYWLMMAVIAVRPVHMMIVRMVMVVIAVGAVDVGFVVHVASTTQG